jgi:hypothetical protein
MRILGQGERRMNGEWFLQKGGHYGRPMTAPRFTFPGMEFLRPIRHARQRLERPWVLLRNLEFASPIRRGHLDGMGVGWIFAP